MVLEHHKRRQKDNSEAIGENCRADCYQRCLLRCDMLFNSCPINSSSKCVYCHAVRQNFVTAIVVNVNRGGNVIFNTARAVVFAVLSGRTAAASGVVRHSYWTPTRKVSGKDQIRGDGDNGRSISCRRRCPLRFWRSSIVYLWFGNRL